MGAVYSPNFPIAFAAFDWVVLAVYAAILLGIGFHYYRQQGGTNEEFFVGNRRTHPLLAGISMFAALTSIITYIGVPGEYVQNGPVLVFLGNLISLPFVVYVVGWLMIPAFMRLPITSVYELLETRLGLTVRRTGSLTYIVTRLVWMALILFTTAKVVVHVTGCDPRWSPAIAAAVGLVTTTYTLFGGIRTVMVTEAVQFCLLVLGALLTLGSITWRLGGIGAWWPHAWEPHWAPQPFFSLDPNVRVTVLGTLVYFSIATIASSGSDQSAVQRFLTTRDVPAARRALIVNGVAVVITTFILGLVGAALMGFYRQHADVVPAGVTLEHNGDAFFPLYITQFLPAGVAGLVVASLVAAAMSCLSAGINSVIATVTKDFVENSPSLARHTESQRLQLTRWLALGIGVLLIGGTVVVGAVRGNILEVANKTVNLLGCPLFGIFFLAFFVPRATPFGAMMGAVYSITAAVLVAYWDVLTGKQPVTFLWIAPIAMTASIVAGVGFSFWATRGRSVPTLAAYTLAALTPLIVVCGALLHFAR